MSMRSTLGAAALFGLGAAGVSETRQNKTRASPKLPQAPWGPKYSPRGVTANQKKLKARTYLRYCCRSPGA